MTLILGLIRHGITDWNEFGRTQGQRDIPLNETGRRQAHALGRRIPPRAWDVLYSSDLSRAAETAHIVSIHTKLEPVRADILLRERSFGLLEGLTREERFSQWGERALEHPEVETSENVLKRGMAFIDAVLKRHANQRVLAVSHGAFIRHLLPALLTDQDVPEGALDNASLTILQFDGARWRCLLFNGSVPEPEIS
ncbi:histidine phosphatase family protein [Paenibacillus thermotolerans]|uniref:histidine phosphatase family protein n=1 Tax=Paenibacillus thermotolerans TaxID=3027807 RepID=UPI002367ABA1|nr:MULTISPECIES: histidine phosphatase family protein [unclassified Paenibacillus]